jgi:hypothetical protein
MSKEKQIEEMLADIIKIEDRFVNEKLPVREIEKYLAKALIVDEGYRKHTDGFLLKENGEIIPLVPKQSDVCGEWEKRVWIVFDSEKIGYRCSECNTTWDTPTLYCPNCGAKMKGGAE